MTSNVAATSTTGLYGISGNVYVPNSAQQLLNLLYSNGNVNFSLAPGNTQVQANALVSGGSGTYGNAQVAVYLASNTDPTISTLNANAAVQAVAINTINANLGAFQTYANATFGTSSYGNSNVAAYLASNTDATISALNANSAVQAVAINSINANLGAYQTYANTSINSINANLGAYQTYGNVTFSTVANAASQQTQIDTLQTNAASQATSINTINANLGAFQTYANATFGTSSYGNANVAAYLPTYSGQIGGTIVAPNFSTANAQITGGNASVYNSTATNKFVGSHFDAANSAGGQLRNASGTPQLQWGGGGGNNISIDVAINMNPANAQVSISPTGTGSVDIKPTGHLDINPTTVGFMNNVVIGNATPTSGIFTTLQTSGNITANAGAFFIGNGSQLTGIVASYGNTQVAAYNTNTYGLTADSGAVRLNGVASSFNTLALGASDITIGVGGAGDYINLNNNTTVYDGLFLNGVSGGQTGRIQANATANITLTSGANITAQSGSGVRLQSGATFLADTGTFAGQLTLANVSSTAGYFWANGTAYSTGGASFTGDLAGSTLYDSVNERIIANAYPLSTGSRAIANNSTSKYMVYNPTYTSGVLQQPPLANATTDGTTIVNTSAQTIIMVQSANVGLQSGYAFGSQNRDTVGSLFSTTVYPVTANTMANQDRVRGAIGSIDTVMTGQTWGTMSSTSQAATTLAGINGFINVNGYGNVSAVVGGTYGAFVTPSANQTANIQYQTGVMPFLTMLTTAGTTGKANIVYNRGIAPFITGFSSNLTVQYAVGLHTYSGWAGTGAVGAASNPVLGRFAVLNEDANTSIQTNGNVIITGNTNLGPYRETIAALGNQSGAVTVNYFSGTVQTATLTGNITINTTNITNMPAGGSVTLILTQDATGSRLLTSNLKYAGGSKTLSTSGNSIDILNVFYDGTNYLASLVKGYA